MKKLLLSSLLILVVLALLLVAPQLVGEKGYVLISMGDLLIEMTVVSLVISVVVGLIVLYVLYRLGSALIGLFSGSWAWLGNLSRRRQQRNFYRGIQAFAEGELEAANKAFADTRQRDFDGVNYLIGAQVAYQLDNWQQCQEQLHQAADYPHSRLAAVLMEARMLLRRNQPEDALKVVNSLEDKDADHRQVIRIKADCLAQLGQWQEIQNQLPQWRKTLKKDAVPLAQRAARGKFAEIASKQGANALKQYWQDLPRKKRNDPAFRAAYAEQLIEQGMHKDAQDSLVEWQRSGPDEYLLPLFRAISMPQPTAAIQLLESWLKKDSENAQLYSILGQLAFNAGDLALAERVLLKAVKLEESPADLMLLAQISERQHEDSKALAFYKQGMAAT